MARLRTAVALAALTLGCGGDVVEASSASAETTTTGGSTSTTTTTSSTSTSSGSTSGSGSTGSTTAVTSTTGTVSSSEGSSSVDSSTGSSSETSGSESGSTTTGPITCEDLNPEDGPPADCSMNSNEPIIITFVNECETETVQVYWVNYQCNEILYGTLTPGQSYGQGTFASHPWRIRDASDQRLLKEVPPPPAMDITVTVP